MNIFYRETCPICKKQLNCIKGTNNSFKECYYCPALPCYTLYVEKEEGEYHAVFRSPDYNVNYFIHANSRSRTLICDKLGDSLLTINHIITFNFDNVEEVVNKIKLYMVFS